MTTWYDHAHQWTRSSPEAQRPWWPLHRQLEEKKAGKKMGQCCTNCSSMCVCILRMWRWVCGYTLVCCKMAWAWASCAEIIAPLFASPPDWNCRHMHAHIHTHTHAHTHAHTHRHIRQDKRTRYFQIKLNTPPSGQNVTLLLCKKGKRLREKQLTQNHFFCRVLTQTGNYGQVTPHRIVFKVIRRLVSCVWPQLTHLTDALVQINTA